MIDKAILKKHNLKAVPFSAIGEGQTFWSASYKPCHAYRLIDDSIVWADGYDSVIVTSPAYFKDMTVYVPIWRPC